MTICIMYVGVVETFETNVEGKTVRKQLEIDNDGCLSIFAE